MKHEAIDDFLARVKKLARSGSKDMRLSVEEANVLAISLAELMSRLDQQAGATPVAVTPYCDRWWVVSRPLNPPELEQHRGFEIME